MLYLMNGRYRTQYLDALRQSATLEQGDTCDEVSLQFQIGGCLQFFHCKSPGP